MFPAEADAARSKTTPQQRERLELSFPLAERQYCKDLTVYAGSNTKRVEVTHGLALWLNDALEGTCKAVQKVRVQGSKHLRLSQVES